MNLSFVFFGTPDFSVKILDSLRRAGLSPDLIITAPDKPRGRKQKMIPLPVKTWAQKNKIPFSQPPSKRELVLLREKIKNIQPHVFIIASYGLIIPQEVLSLAKRGALNVHPSFLQAAATPALRRG